MQIHKHQRKSTSRFPSTCKIKEKHQIHRITHKLLPKGPASCWEEKKTGDTVLRRHHQVDRGGAA